MLIPNRIKIIIGIALLLVAPTALADTLTVPSKDFPTLTDAGLSVEDGDTITLAGDIDEGTCLLRGNRAYTLEGNGHTIHGGVLILNGEPEDQIIIRDVQFINDTATNEVGWTPCVRIASGNSVDLIGCDFEAPTSYAVTGFCFTDETQPSGGPIRMVDCTDASYGVFSCEHDVWLCNTDIATIGSAPVYHDHDCDGSIGLGDLLAVIAGWGTQYWLTDLLNVIANWGATL